MKQDKVNKEQTQWKLTQSKSMRICLALFLLSIIYFLFVFIDKPVQSASVELAKKQTDWTAVLVNAFTLVGGFSAVVGAVWGASQELNKIQSTLKEDFTKKLDDLTIVINTKNDEALIREVALRLELVESIKELDKALVKSTGESMLAVANLRYDMEKAMSTNLQEIMRVHSKFEVGVFGVEASLESLEKQHEHLRQTANTSDILLEQRYVNLQRELQHLLRGFNRRLLDIEKVLERKFRYIPREEAVNVDIEGLG